MKFTISRASIWDKEIQPHPLAVAEQVQELAVSHRTIKSQLVDGTPVYSIDPSQEIVRNITKTIWYIDFNTLEEFVAFATQEPIILSDGGKYPHIHIYDANIE